MGKIVEQTRLSSLGRATNLGEGKLNTKPEECCSGEPVEHCRITFFWYQFIQKNQAAFSQVIITINKITYVGRSIVENFS